MSFDSQGSMTPSPATGKRRLERSISSEMTSHSLRRKKEKAFHDVPPVPFAVLEELLNNTSYERKELPPLPTESAQQSPHVANPHIEAKVSSILEHAIKCKPGPYRPFVRPSSVQLDTPKRDRAKKTRTDSEDTLGSVEQVRMETLVNTVHKQEREIRQLKKQMATRDTAPASPSVHDSIPSEVEMLKALNANMTHELSKTFIALKIAHSQLQTARREIQSLTETNQALLQQQVSSPAQSPIDRRSRKEKVAPARVDALQRQRRKKKRDRGKDQSDGEDEEEGSSLLLYLSSSCLLPDSQRRPSMNTSEENEIHPDENNQNSDTPAPATTSDTSTEQ